LNEKLHFIVNVIGLFLSVCGSILPWGNELYLPIFYIGVEPWNYIIGIELTLGQFAFFSSIIAAISLAVYWISRNKYALVFVFAGGLTTTLCSLLWIISPGFLEPISYIKYTVSYGAYVSLMGGWVTLIGVILNFLWRRKLYAS